MMGTIIASAARALWVSWWADQCSCGFDSETCRLDGDGLEGWDPDAEHVANDPGGVELMDVAPDTPPDAVEAATALMGRIEGLGALLERADVQGDPEDFGHYLAMEALGTGVSWDGHYLDPHGLDVPYIEYHGA